MEESSSIRVRYDNRLSEHLHASRLYESHRWLHKVDKVVAVLLVALGVYAVCSVGLVWWTLLPFLLALLEWFNLLSIRPLQIRVWYRMNPKFSEPYDIEFSDSGVHFLTPTMDSSIAWTFYCRVVESDRIFLLYYGKGMYSVIPKRAFESQEQIDQFRQLAQHHIQASPNA